MILVLSFSQFEQGTEPVIDWLLYYQADFVKVSINDLLRTDVDFKIDVGKGRIYFKGEDITQKINVIWHRRFEDDININISGAYEEQITFEIQNEINVLIDYLKLILKNKKWLPCNDGIKREKLEVSLLADKLGIPTPKTIITNSRASAVEFAESVGGALIIKPIRHSSYFIEGDKTYAVYTRKIDIASLKQIPENFVLTLFQECITANLEIRTFYLDGKFYSTAIVLSANQTGKEKKIDIKLHYNTDYINWVPYKLPSEFKKKLQKLMKHCLLNTASIDVVKTPEGEYVLLEVNPVGQYSAPGHRCNYYLEEKIAKWLLSNDKAKEDSI